MTAEPAGYDAAVSDWHEARADAWEKALLENDGDAGFLVWGDPAFYDSTIRVLERVLERGRSRPSSTSCPASPACRCWRLGTASCCTTSDTPCTSRPGDVCRRPSTPARTTSSSC